MTCNSCEEKYSPYNQKFNECYYCGYSICEDCDEVLEEYKMICFDISHQKCLKCMMYQKRLLKKLNREFLDKHDYRKVFYGGRYKYTFKYVSDAVDDDIELPN